MIIIGGPKHGDVSLMARNNRKNKGGNPAQEQYDPANVGRQHPDATQGEAGSSGAPRESERSRQQQPSQRGSTGTMQQPTGRPVGSEIEEGSNVWDEGADIEADVARDRPSVTRGGSSEQRG